MTRNTSSIDRRTALRTLAVSAIGGVAGCLSESGPPSRTDSGGGTDEGTDDDPFQRVAVDGTTLVVELASDADIEQVNLIQPNGELWGTRGVAAGADRVSFEFRGAYTTGEYDVLGVADEETVVEESLEIRPNLNIQEVGLHRTHPDKPWEEVYGESDMDRLTNGQAFVTVENSGTGPETVTELTFSGDVPRPVESPWSNGIQRSDKAVIPAGHAVDLYTTASPFGSVSPDGMGCSSDANSGQFAVRLEAVVNSDSVTQAFDVQYSGSSDMADCVVSITEVE